jgi:hypothetical protein
MSGAPSASSQSSPHISGASQPGSVADEAAHVQLQSPKTESDARQQREVGSYALPANSDGNSTPATVKRLELTRFSAISHNAPFQFANPGGGAWTEQHPPLHQYPQQHRASIADPQYWSVNSTPTATHYSHDSAISFNATTPTTFASPNFAYTQSGIPTRSMSFGHIEGMSQQFSYQGVQYGHQETQAGYPVPPHSQYGHPGLPPQAQGSIPNERITSESVPRTWNAPPSIPAPLAASGQYAPTIPNSYYPHQQPVAAYDNRSHPHYQQHAQYYPTASNPS